MNPHKKQQVFAQLHERSALVGTNSLQKGQRTNLLVDLRTFAIAIEFNPFVGWVWLVVGFTIGFILLFINCERCYLYIYSMRWCYSSTLINIYKNIEEYKTIVVNSLNAFKEPSSKPVNSEMEELGNDL